MPAIGRWDGEYNPRPTTHRTGMAPTLAAAPDTHAPHRGRPGASGPIARIGGRVVCWLLALAAFANAAAYIAHAGNPLVSSDAWYFIDAFLRKAMEQGATLQDYYVKRSLDDHAQPLLKLLLLANARWWGLDFVFEALVGLAFAALTYLALVRAVAVSPGALPPGWSRGLALGTLAACLVTLNAGMVFNWSLVTLAYLPYLAAVIGGLCAWRVLAGGDGLVALAACAIAIAFLFDGMGVLVSLAIVLASLFCAWRTPQARGRAARVVAVFALAEAAYLILGRPWLMPGLASAGGGAGAAAGLASMWALLPQAWEIARTVFGSTMAHIFTLTHYAGDAGTARQWQGALALAAIALHAWFWFAAWRLRWNAAGLVAVLLMLLLYGLVAGVLLTRVPVNGIDYLHEPRYVVFYLLGNVALLMMHLAGGAHPSRRRAWAAGLMAILLLALQWPLSRFTWWDGQYLNAYYHTMAVQTYALGQGVRPANCVALVTACDMPPQSRDAALRFLQEHRLNLYSPAFVHRYRLQSLAPAAQRNASD